MSLQIFERDEEAKKNAPEVIKEEIENEKHAAESTPADSTTFANLIALGQLQNVSEGGELMDPDVELDHKFGLPDLPLPSDANLHYRYDPVVEQVTNLMMEHGKLGAAQRVCFTS